MTRLQVIRCERGIAMVSALLAVVVATTLGVTVMNLALHTTEASAYDRARTQSVHAAEAGLNQALAMLNETPLYTKTSVYSLPCGMDGVLSATPPATWNVAIDYYVSDDLTGTPMVCDPTIGYLVSDVHPSSVRLYATGTVQGWADGTVERHMETQVTLTPVYGGFNKAIFSVLSPNIQTNLTVYGENGNNADFLTNENWYCNNNITIYGNVVVRGNGGLANSCRIAVDMWVGGSIAMTNFGRVDHNLKASTGSLSMSTNTYIGNNATVGTTCTGCAGKVGGTLTTGNLQPIPPLVPFPTMVFSEEAWVEAEWSVEYFTDCTAAKSRIMSSAFQNTRAVIRITGGCSLTFSQNNTITRGADLAIFTDGEIVSTNNSSFTSSSSDWHDLFLIVESHNAAGTPTSCAGTDGRVSMSNLTSFNKLAFFIYSPCYSTFNNNNTSGRGQIYGQTVEITNNLAFGYHSMLVPGNGDVVGYRTDLRFIREVD